MNRQYLYIKLLNIFITFIFIFFMSLFYTNNVFAQQIYNIDTTDCSNQGGNAFEGGFWVTHGGCSNVSNTSFFGTWWDNFPRPAIHIKSTVEDKISIHISTDMLGSPGDFYSFYWGTTYVDWSGLLGGGWFGCNGSWGCPRLNNSDDPQSPFQGVSSHSGASDYYLVAVAQCKYTNNDCLLHLTITCNSCQIVGNQPPVPQLKVITNVINDNGGTKNPSDFTLNIGGENQTISSFQGNESGTDLELNSGFYSITENPVEGYSVSYGDGCTGSINAGETKTCIVSNDDIAPLKKVILIPGLGAAWNAKAMLTCGEPDDSGWSLAPYAVGIYKPLIYSLNQSGKNVEVFNYDWRKPVRYNSSIFSSQTGTEKFDIVGHSMGGLLTRDYLQNTTNLNLVNSAYLVGAPNNGSVLAYPAWEWGEIWSDNFIEKIAMTLYLKMCGYKGVSSTDSETIQNKFPVIKDLLPTFNNFIIDQKTKNYIPQISENQWLTELNNRVFPQIKMGTLSGTGFNTLQAIQVKNGSKQNSSGKIMTLEGDGTVLLTSSRINNIDSDVINETHTNLVASEEGILKIENFLGIANPSKGLLIENPQSALVVISYPSNFWINDEKGESYNGNDGIASIVNPKSGNFKVNILPKSSETRFIVAQFLKNGELKYKEYKFKGLGPINKVLKFDDQNPQEDILN